MQDKLEKIFKNRQVGLLLVLILVAVALAATRGIHFGIEFEGGTRIPITLERPIDTYTMSELTSNIKSRASNFGLQQVLVKAIGESEIYLELPKSDPALINNTIEILKKQGQFEGIVDGQVAVSGDYIMPGSIRETSPLVQGQTVKWEISFAVTEQGAIHFAETVKGKADYPVYMFLDRPDDAVLLLRKSELVGNATLTEQEALQVLNDVLRKEGTTIPLIIIDDWNASRVQLQALNKTLYPKAIVSEDADPLILEELNTTLGFNVVTKPSEEMVPLYSIQPDSIRVNEWRAVGLLSSPLLNKAITEGRINRFYSISGYAPGNMPVTQQVEIAQNETKTLKSVLSGGALPVKIIIGTPTTIPAPLGAEFLRYSLIAAVLTIVFVVGFLYLRYRNPLIVGPVFFIISSEIFILICILGSLGTIDLGAMAGIIGVVGTGVDAQIVIADEVLSRKGKSTKRQLSRAFNIIMTNATTSVVAMVPLLFFSGLVEIMGFALSVIFGVFIGAFVTRPAYGKIIEVLVEE